MGERARGGKFLILNSPPPILPVSPSRFIKLPRAPGRSASREFVGKNPYACAHTPTATPTPATGAIAAPRGPALPAPSRRTPPARPSRLPQSTLRDKDQMYLPLLL